MDRFALFDTNMTLLKEVKDISFSVTESIRNIYGINTTVDLSEYPDLTAKEVATAVLKKHNLKHAEIEERLDRYCEDLPYSYYNVLWSDRVVVMDGAKSMLELLQKKDVGIGIATGDPERVAKMRLDKVGLSGYFTFGTYAENGISPTDILESGMDKIGSELGLQTDQGMFFTASPRFVNAAKAVGLYAIGVADSGAKKQALKDAGASEIISTLKEKPKMLSRI